MWVLIIFIHAGILSDGDSVALTNVPGFKNENICKIAGESSLKLSDKTFKNTKYVCVKQE